MHVSSKSKVKGLGTVYIHSRNDALTTGNFTLKIDALFDPPVSLYPTGTFKLEVSLSDGSTGTFICSTIELINTYGKHNPTVVLTGQCKDEINPDAKGCRYWIIIANNKTSNEPATADIVGFAIHDNLGNRIAYGMGPVRSGDFEVAPA